MRIVDFEYGAEPSDWRLHWDAEVERYVGDFWSSIENIGGGWIVGQGII